jgi:sialate O-acetylesterase
MSRIPRCWIVGLIVSCGVVAAYADGLKLPALFSDGMVLQADMHAPIWGRAMPGAPVLVTLDSVQVEGVADENGRWKVFLPARPASFDEVQIHITSEEDRVIIEGVLFGEVWLCSGQSNMEWPVMRSNDADLETLVAQYPYIRLLHVPHNGTQEYQEDFEGAWKAVSSATVTSFSAVGYHFGRWLHRALQVPVGVIDNSWGGSSAEAWIRRDLLEADDRFKTYMQEWLEIEATYNYDKVIADWEEKYAEWQAEDKACQAAGQPREREPNRPKNRLENQHRPGNLYAGVLHPLIGYGLRGVIWYQGESNAGRASQYQYLFPLMIQHWREEWGQGDFPFYWVQLTSFRDRVEEPVDEKSKWAIIREAQTASLALPNTGQAVTYDLGEGRDIHPRDKQNVARRLARLALANVYGKDVASRSPAFDRMEKHKDGIMLYFKDVDKGLYSFEVKEPRGFAIAGEDRVWQHAETKIEARDAIYVSNPDVPEPVAVRYAWADNPDANVQDRNGLPLTPFRTDDWPIVLATE